MEGYTNFLWTILLAATTRAGLDPESAARRLGLLSALGALAGSHALSRRCLPAYPLAWPVPALLLACNSFFALEAVQGLETALFACLLTAGLCVAATAFAPRSSAALADGALPSGVGRTALAAGLLALAALTRPEGMLLAAVVAALRGTQLARARRHPGPAEAIGLAVFTTPIAAHLLFRLWYYGDWLPNTFYAKTGGGTNQLWRGWDYLGGGLLRIAPWAALAALAAAGLAQPRPGRNRRALALVGAVWLASAAGIVAMGGDFKPTFRFLACGAPLLAVLAAAGLIELREASRQRLGPSAAPAIAAGLAAVTLIWTFVGTEQARTFASQRARDLPLLREAADWFARELPADAVIATGPSGAIPYYTDRTTVDMWGLNDRDIARRVMPEMGSGSAGHEKGDGARVLGKRPNVILFTAARFTPQPLSETELVHGWLSVSERELLALREFRRIYRWRSVRLPSASLNFYQRADGLGDSGEGTEPS